MTGVHIKRRNLNIHSTRQCEETEIQGTHHVMKKAETG